MSAANPENESPYPTLGSKVRHRRRELGLTLKEVGAASGVSVPFLSQIENGKHMPSLTTLFRLAPVLATTAEWLLGSVAVGPVSMVRAEEGDVYAVTTEKSGATRRQITADDDPYAVSEYEVPAGSSLGGDFQSSSGRQLLYVLSGRLAVELQVDGELRRYELGAGDALSYDATLAHHWQQVGRRAVRFINVLG